MQACLIVAALASHTELELLASLRLAQPSHRHMLLACVSGMGDGTAAAGVTALLYEAADHIMPSDC